MVGYSGLATLDQLHDDDDERERERERKGERRWQQTKANDLCSRSVHVLVCHRVCVCVENEM